MQIVDRGPAGDGRDVLARRGVRPVRGRGAPRTPATLQLACRRPAPAGRRRSRSARRTGCRSEHVGLRGVDGSLGDARRGPRRSAGPSRPERPGASAGRLRVAREPSPRRCRAAAVRPVRGSWSAESASVGPRHHAQSDRLLDVEDDHDVRARGRRGHHRTGPGEREAKVGSRLGGSAPSARSAAYRAASTKASDGEACAATRTVCVSHCRASVLVRSVLRQGGRPALLETARASGSDAGPQPPTPATLSTTSRNCSRSRLIAAHR